MVYDKHHYQMIVSILLVFFMSFLLSFFLPVFLVLLCLLISVLALVLSYFKKRKEKVDELHRYLQKLNREDYSYDINAYEEGELARIHGELNKTMVSMQAMNQRLIQQKQLLARQLQDVSHQLKTPLTALMLLNDLQEESEIGENIHLQIERMKLLVDSLIKLVKADAQLLPYKPSLLRFEDLLNPVLDSLEVHLTEKKLKITVTGKDTEVFVDSKLMFEVLYNIIDNKISYAQHFIYIDVSKLGIWTSIRIWDDGDAILHPDKVFERFYTYPSRAKSLGIGLAYAKRIIDLHQGKIRVEGDNAFVIELDEMTKV